MKPGKCLRLQYCLHWNFLLPVLGRGYYSHKDMTNSGSVMHFHIFLMALHFLSGSLLLLWLFIPFYVIGCCDISAINYSWLKSIAQQRCLSTVTEFRGKLRICKQKLHTREQNSYHCSSKVWQIWCFHRLGWGKWQIVRTAQETYKWKYQNVVGADDKKRHDEYCQCGIPHYYKFRDHLQLMSDCCI